MIFKSPNNLWLFLLEPELSEIDFIQELQGTSSPLNFNDNFQENHENISETGVQLIQTEQYEVCLIHLKKVQQEHTIKLLIQFLNKKYRILGMVYVLSISQWVTDDNQPLSHCIQVLKKFSKQIIQYQSHKIQLGLYLQNTLKQFIAEGYLINLQEKNSKLTQQLINIQKNAWQIQDAQEQPNLFWEQNAALLKWNELKQKIESVQKKLKENGNFKNMQLCCAAIPGNNKSNSILKKTFLILHKKNHYRLTKIKKIIAVFSLFFFLYTVLALAIEFTLYKHNQPLEQATKYLAQHTCDPMSWQQLQNWQHQLNQASLKSIKATYYLFPIQHQTYQKTVQQQTKKAKYWINQCTFEKGLQALHQDLNRYLEIVQQKKSNLASHEHAYRILKVYLMAYSNVQRDIAATAQTLLGYALTTEKEKDAKLNTNQVMPLIEESLVQWEPKDPKNELMINDVRNQLIAYANRSNEFTIEQWWLINQLNGLSQSTNIVAQWPDQLIEQFDITVPVSGLYTGKSSKANQQLQDCFNQGCSIYDWVLNKNLIISATDTNILKQKNWQKNLIEQFNNAWTQGIKNIIPKSKLEINELNALGQQVLSNQAQAIQMISKKIESAEQFLNIHTNTNNLFSNEKKLKQIEELGISAYNSLSILAATESNAAWGILLNSTNHPITQFLQSITLEKTKSNKPTTQALLDLMTRPLHLALHKIYTKHIEKMNIQWQQHSRTQLLQITQLYPFNNKGNDATAEELKQIIEQNNTSVQEFLENQFGIQIKSIQKFNSYLQQSWQWGYRIDLDPNFMLLINRLQNIQNKQPTSGLAEFEINILPDPEFQEQYLTFEGQTIAYRNGLEQWHLLSWQGQEHEQGLRIHVVKTNGQTCNHAIASGRMSWIKSLRKARIENQGNVFKLSWPICNEQHQHFVMRYRHISGISPNQINFLNQWPLPNNLIKGLEYAN